MKNINILMLGLVSLALTGTAFASTECHRILEKDHIAIGIKGYDQAGKFYMSPETVTESPLLPAGKFRLQINNGGLYSMNLVIKDPAKCDKKIEYEVNLAYKGKTLLNEGQSIAMNRWTPVYSSKPDHIQIFIKAVHKPA